MRLGLMTLLCMGFIFKTTAQLQTHNVKLLTKVAIGGVWLRWAPTDFTTWQLGNKYGYTIERYTLRKDGTLENKEPVLLNSTSIKPFTAQRLEDLSKTIDHAAILQELIYGTDGNSEMKSESPMALLKQNEDMNNRFGMALLVCDLSYRLAEAAGLFWFDKTAAKGFRYIYKIKLSDLPANLKVEPAVGVVEVEEIKPLIGFKDAHATFGDKKVTLSWPVLTHKGVYSAYIIEKSSDGKTFKPITDLPYMPMSEVTQIDEAHFVDSLSNNNTTFYYQIKGITPFGEVGPPSNVLKGSGQTDLSGLAIIREVKRNEKNKVVVRWEFPVSYQAKINNFVLSRAPKADGPFVDITAKSLTKASREFVDDALTMSTYYRLKAVDVAGKELTHSQPYFFHVEDKVPPAIPIELSGTSDKTGVVTLKWKANRDNDLMGYRVFSSNDLNHEFVEVTSKILSDNFYQDTINNKVLNKKIYYSVIAVDNNFNTSNYSKPCTVARPDLIPPIPPLFSSVETVNKAVSLQWINSSSSDAATYVLSRKMADDTTKNEILQWNANKSLTSYSDNSVIEGKTYQYLLSVADSAGNKSVAASKEIRVEIGVKAEVTDLKALIDRENKIIILRWAYESPVKKCLLYRKKNDEPFTLYQSLDGSLSEFIDKLVTINNTYSYKIQMVLETNAKTKLSETLKVPF